MVKILTSDTRPPHPDEKSQLPDLISPSLYQSIEETAVNFLLSSYITDSHFEYLPTLSKLATTGGPLMTCIRAVGLASISHDLGRPELMAASRHQYTQALRTTGKALQCPDRAMLDETLASVMLLALFEIVAHRDEESSDQWTSHVNGAVALLVHRGPMQFKSTYGLLLFNQIRSNINVNCIQRRLRLPSDLTSLTAQAAPFLDNANPISRFSAITEALTDLLAAIEDGQITEAACVTRLARELDSEARSLALDMPAAGWSYEVLSREKDDSAVFGKAYHIYKDHRVAQMWNTIRMTRLLLNQTIHETLVHASPDDFWDTIPAQFSHPSENPAKIAREMATAILASIPQFTQFSPDGNALFSPTVASSCFLLWPLELVGSSRLSTPSMCAYAIGRLRYMDTQMKVRQARQVADKLEQGSLSQDW